MLSLNLQNFRCFIDKKISLPESGVTLINAPSGSGKSTILSSILYAITGKLKNISTFGKKTASVSLDIDGIKITRTKLPNKLSVVDQNSQKRLEDAEAQETIDKIFGKEFATVSYIDQDNINSFIFLSPSDKMDFLQNLLLKEYEIDGIKEKIKLEISTTKEEYIAQSSKIDALTSLLNKENFPETLPDLEISGIHITRKNFFKALETSKNNLTTSELNTKKLEDKIKKLEAERILFSKKQMLQNFLDDLLSQKNDLSAQISDQKIKELEEKKKKYLLNKDLTKYRTKLKELKEKYSEVSSKNADEIRCLKERLKNHQPEPDRLTNYKKCVAIYHRIYELDEKIPESLDVLKEQIDKISEDIDGSKKLLTEKETFLKNSELCYECPSCKKILKMLGQELVLLESSKKLSNSEKESHLEEIKDLKKKIETSEKKKSSLKKELTIHEKNTEEYNSLFNRLEELFGSETVLEMKDIEKEVETMEENDKKFKDLSNKIQSTYEDSLERQLQTDIKAYTKTIEKIVNEGGDQTDVDEEEFLKITETLALTKEFSKRLMDIEKKIQDVEKDIQNLGQMPQDAPSAEDIEKKKKQLDEWTGKVSLHRKNITTLEDYSRLVRDIEKYEKIKKDIEDASNIKEEKNLRVKALSKLREHVKNAERKSVSQFIDSLNSHASVYLENFFPDEPIAVNLKTIQELKTGKEKIALNFEVNYKGMNECDLSSLSGGERDRVNLAFTLALSEMVDNRVLMLDECISSLDIEASNKVVETLREKYKGRLVLLISHQIGTGGFDHILNL